MLSRPWRWTRPDFSPTSIRFKILARSTEATTAFHMKTLSRATTDSITSLRTWLSTKLSYFYALPPKNTARMELSETATGNYNKK